MSEEELVRFDKLAQTVVLTAQGIPSIFAGEEMLRTKGGVSNSHDSPDRVNRIDWSFKADHKDVFDYYRGLIALRRTHPAFRLATAAEIERHLRFLDTGDTHVVAYMLVDHAGTIRGGRFWSCTTVRGPRNECGFRRATGMRYVWTAGSPPRRWLFFRGTASLCRLLRP